MLMWIPLDLATPAYVYVVFALPFILLAAIVVGAVILIVRLVRRRNDPLGGAAPRLDDRALRG